MTKSLFAPLSSSYLGFDSFFNDVDRLLSIASTSQDGGGYPPMNLYKEDNGDYTIELAVAGFTEEHIKIEHDEQRGILTVIGDTSPRATDIPVDAVVPSSFAADQNKRQVISKGIATRKFVRSFKLEDHLEVAEASLNSGMLTITIRKDEDKAYRPKQIQLSNRPSLEHKQPE